MYEQYSKETQDKIRELGLWGKEPREIIIESMKACNRMSNDITMNNDTKQVLGQLEALLYEYISFLKDK